MMEINVWLICNRDLKWTAKLNCFHSTRCVFLNKKRENSEKIKLENSGLMALTLKL